MLKGVRCRDCVRTQFFVVLRCVRTQFLIYINKLSIFHRFLLFLLVALQKPRTFASSKGTKRSRASEKIGSEYRQRTWMKIQVSILSYRFW